MTRLFDEERGQLACQKTLGMGNFQIVGKYVLFVAVATLLGGGIAYPVGYGLTSMLYTGFNIQYEVPVSTAGPGFYYYLIAFAIIFLATTGLTFISSMH
jgi:predicted lysophospholipase L1 biosynthesis ABC-type transport system permease subunit